MSIPRIASAFCRKKHGSHIQASGIEYIYFIFNKLVTDIFAELLGGAEETDDSVGRHCILIAQAVGFDYIRRKKVIL